MVKNKTHPPIPSACFLSFDIEKSSRLIGKANFTQTSQCFFRLYQKVRKKLKNFNRNIELFFWALDGGIFIIKSAGNIESACNSMVKAGISLIKDSTSFLRSSFKKIAPEVASSLYARIGIHKGDICFIKKNCNEVAYSPDLIYLIKFERTLTVPNKLIISEDVRSCLDVKIREQFKLERKRWTIKKKSDGSHQEIKKKKYLYHVWYESTQKIEKTENIRDKYRFFLREGKTLLSKTRYREASQQFFNAIGINPQSIEAIRKLGETFEKLGDKKEAKRLFKKVSQLEDKSEGGGEK